MKKVLVLTGAGISAESGLKTFRDSDGLWENYNVYDVATPQAWAKNPALVQEFYNKRREQCLSAKPNAGHLALVELEKEFNVQIITQNVDDLHEKAGSTNILHLHGELNKARSSVDENLIYDLKGKDINMGDFCEKGSQLRPHIVWFGEMVPNIEIAQKMMRDADYLLIIGTSLNVYPAAGLVSFVPAHCKTFLIDPNDCPTGNISNLTTIKEGAGTGVSKAIKIILQDM
ncbi:MAG: NAD-dependent deacylase [Bacteroidetes bacterium]|nr:NAD-dependent deacylase [Bacteroidota bacterium]